MLERKSELRKATFAEFEALHHETVKRQIEKFQEESREAAERNQRVLKDVSELLVRCSNLQTSVVSSYNVACLADEKRKHLKSIENAQPTWKAKMLQKNQDNLEKLRTERELAAARRAQLAALSSKEFALKSALEAERRELMLELAAESKIKIATDGQNKHWIEQRKELENTIVEELTKHGTSISSSLNIGGVSREEIEEELRIRSVLPAVESVRYESAIADRLQEPTPAKTLPPRSRMVEPLAVAPTPALSTKTDFLPPMPVVETSDAVSAPLTPPTTAHDTPPPPMSRSNSIGSKANPSALFAESALDLVTSLPSYPAEDPESSSPPSASLVRVKSLTSSPSQKRKSPTRDSLEEGILTPPTESFSPVHGKEPTSSPRTSTKSQHSEPVAPTLDITAVSDAALVTETKTSFTVEWKPNQITTTIRQLYGRLDEAILRGSNASSPNDLKKAYTRAAHSTPENMEPRLYEVQCTTVGRILNAALNRRDKELVIYGLDLIVVSVLTIFRERATDLMPM